MNLTEQQDPWADWNRWCESKIETALREFAPGINEAFDDLTDEANRALKELRGEIDELAEAITREREKNAKLRSDVEVLRVMIRSQNVGVITRSKRDDA
jgi:hypothetical protein